VAVVISAVLNKFGRDKSAEKMQEIHVMVNSKLSDALKKIEHLEAELRRQKTKTKGRK
jgi:hypothetical protein